MGERQRDLRCMTVKRRRILASPLLHRRRWGRVVRLWGASGIWRFMIGVILCICVLGRDQGKSMLLSCWLELYSMMYSFEVFWYLWMWFMRIVKYRHKYALKTERLKDISRCLWKLNAYEAWTKVIPRCQDQYFQQSNSEKNIYIYSFVIACLLILIPL